MPRVLLSSIAVNGVDNEPQSLHGVRELSGIICNPICSGVSKQFRESQWWSEACPGSRGTPGAKGNAMTATQQQTEHTGPLVELIRSFHREIAKLRHHQQEETQQEITWEQAVELWLQRGFPDWKRVQWQRAVNQATKDTYRGGKTKPRRRSILDSLPPESSQIQVPVVTAVPRGRRERVLKLSFYRAMRAVGRNAP